MQKAKLIKIIVACVALLVAGFLVLKAMGVFSGGDAAVGASGEPVKLPNTKLPGK